MPAVAPKVVHCLLERNGDQWQAFSLELGLAAQGDSAQAASAKLEAMVKSYVYDAIYGEDKDFAEELLSRKATAAVHARYYLAALLLGLKRCFHFEKFSDSRTYEVFA